MSRHNLTDREWNAIRVCLPAENNGRVGRPWKSHRQVINGIMFVLRTGIAWRDVPQEFGIATRYVKRIENYMAMINLAIIRILLNWH